MSTDRLVEDLARNVSPVAPLPRIRTVLFGVLAVWALAFGAVMWLGSGAVDPDGAVPHGDPRFLLVGLGFGVFAVGATLRALAGAIPGREPTAGAGVRVAAIGAAVIALAFLWVFVGGGSALGDLGGSMLCMGHAVMLALLPLVAVSLFLARAYVRNPAVAAAFAATGTIGLGALAVHVSCHGGGWLHVLLGHAFAPFAVGCLLAIPLGLALRLWSRREGAAG
jgi:hypothetical protein